VKLLEKRSCQVEPAADGRLPVEKVLRDQSHLVLMDCQMPELSGLDANREIRAAMRGQARVPIMALTTGSWTGNPNVALKPEWMILSANPLRADDVETALEKWAPAPGENSAFPTV